MAEGGQMIDVAVIGGGISGLAAAYRLRRTAPELKVALLEATNHLGGKIGTEQFEGYVMEWGPDCFLSRKPRGVGLCEELGIAGELVGRNSNHAKTFILRNGRLHRLPDGLTGLIPTNLEALTNSTLLSQAAKDRLAQEPAVPPKSAGGDESVAAFLSRRLGQETFENLVEPLMAGIYAGQAEQLSLEATFPQLRQLELKHGSLLAGLKESPATPADTGYPPFVSFPGGMQRLVTRLVDCLQGLEIWRGAAVTSIRKTDSGYFLEVSSKGLAVEGVEARAVVLTTPAYVSGQLLRDMNDELAGLLGQIPYASTALVNAAFNESDVPELDGYGYVIPNVGERQALACTWSSRKWEQRAPEGKVLVRVYIGRYGQPDVTVYEDGRLQSIARSELRETLGISAEPLFQHIVRYPKAMPQYNLGHLDKVTAINHHLEQYRGLYLAGAAFEGVGIPDCIRSGEKAAEKVAGYLRELFSKDDYEYTAID